MLIIQGVYQVFYNEGGAVIGHFGVQNDVTEEVQHQRALEDYKKKLNVLLDAITEALWDWDIKNNKLVTSESWLTM